MGGGQQAEPVAEPKKQPEKKVKTEANSNGENAGPKRRVMKIDLDDEEEEEEKPEIVKSNGTQNGDYVEVLDVKAGSGVVEPKAEAEVMDVE